MDWDKGFWVGWCFVFFGIVILQSYTIPQDFCPVASDHQAYHPCFFLGGVAKKMLFNVLCFNLTRVPPACLLLSNKAAWRVLGRWPLPLLRAEFVKDMAHLHRQLAPAKAGKKFDATMIAATRAKNLERSCSSEWADAISIFQVFHALSCRRTRVWCQ